MMVLKHLKRIRVTLFRGIIEQSKQYKQLEAQKVRVRGIPKFQGIMAQVFSNVVRVINSHILFYGLHYHMEVVFGSYESSGTSKMSQQGRVLVTKPDDLSSTPQSPQGTWRKLKSASCSLISFTHQLKQCPFDAMFNILII